MTAEYDRGHKEFAKKLQAEGRKGVASHWPFGAQDLLEGEVFLLTVLRHPLQRVPSYYGFVRRQALRGMAPKKHKSVVSALENDTVSGFVKDYWRVQNGMVRQLSGVGLGYKGPMEKDHFDLAVKNMGVINFVGVTPRLGALIKAVGKFFGTNPPVRRDNTTPSKPVVTDKDKKEIMRFNKWDVRLYELAEKRAP